MLVLCLFAPALAPGVRVSRPSARHAPIVALDQATATAELQKAQAAALNRVVNELGLFELGPFETPLGNTRSFANEPPTADSAQLGLEESRRIAQGEVQKTGTKRCEVSWCSALNMVGAGQSLSALTCWNTPVIEVPHLFSSVGATASAIELTIDFRPRADAGYDTALPDGSFPEPTDRNMFMQGSLRKDFAAAYFTPEAEAWCAGLKAAAGASVRQRSIPTGCAGPLLLELSFPLTDASLAAAAAACDGAVALWLGWMGALLGVAGCRGWPVAGVGG